MCVIVLCVAILAVPISGLTGIAENASAAPKESVLRIGFLQKIDSMNPYMGMSDAAYVFYGLVYDALGVIDNKMQPAPDLALSWYAVPLTDAEMLAHPEYPYGSVWQYNLTRNATFSDGEPFTADDVVFNINLNAGNYSSMWAYQPYSYYMRDAVKVDDYTVRIHYRDKVTNKPSAAAYAYLVSIPMLPKHKLQEMSAFDIAFKWDGTFSDEDPPIVGTGPFMASSTIKQDYLAGTQLTLLKNPTYHFQKDRVAPEGDPQRWAIKFDKLVFYFYDDASAMTYAIKNKQIDVAAFPPQEFKALKASSPGNMTFYSGPKITMYWTEVGFCMNNAGPNPSRLDRTIRQALSMATNKSYIVENYYRGLADPATTAIAPVDAGWHYEPNATEKAQFAFNIDAANKLLNDSGYYRKDWNPTALRYASNDSYAVKAGLVSEGTELSYQMLIRREYPEEKDIGNYLKQTWRQLGVNLDLRILDEPTMTAEVYKYTYDTMLWYWSSDIDPNYQLFSLSKKAWGGWSDTKWYNASYEENYSKSVTTMDSALRHQAVYNAQRVHYLDAEYIILAYVYQTYAWRTDTFEGWGDWAADPGRSVDNFWMGNPLWFDLKPLGIANDVNGPPIVMIAAAVGAVAAIVAVAVFFKMKGKKKEGKIGESPLGE